MAHLPWRILTRFESVGNSSESSRKQICRNILAKVPYVSESFVFYENVSCSEYTQYIAVLKKIEYD